MQSCKKHETSIARKPGSIGTYQLACKICGEILIEGSAQQMHQWIICETAREMTMEKAAEVSQQVEENLAGIPDNW